LSQRRTQRSEVVVARSVGNDQLLLSIGAEDNPYRWNDGRCDRDRALAGAAALAEETE